MHSGKSSVPFMARSLADVSMNNPPERNRHAVEAEASFRKLQKHISDSRKSYKANAPEQMRQWDSVMRKAKAAEDRRRTYTSKQFGSGGVV